MPEISRDQVAHLAKLSRLALTDEELDRFAAQIDDIVTNVSALLTPEQALDQAPEGAEQRFGGPQILGE